LKSPDSIFSLEPNGTTHTITYFKPLPVQFAPKPELEYDHRGRYWMEKSDCLTCHEFDVRTVGPSFLEIAQRYTDEDTTVEYLTRKIKEGGAGAWGTTPMNPHPGLADRELSVMISIYFH
jgi:cytochrome c